MKILVVEDDAVSRLMMQKLLAPHGEVEAVVDGAKAVYAFQAAHAEGAPFDLVCLDVMLPELDGHGVLAALRKTEEDLAIPPNAHAKVLMTTALGDRQNVMTAFREQADGYLVKPIDRARLTDYLKSFGLVP